MSSPSETGRFWICPECRRHVPARKDACLCGFDRTSVPVRMREVSTTPTPQRREGRSVLSTAWPFVVIAGLVAYIAYGRLSGGTPAPTPSRPAVAEEPTPIPLSDEVVAALDEASAATSAPQPAAPPSSDANPPPAPAPPVIRIEVPPPQATQQQQPQVDAQDLNRQEELMLRQEELRWKTQFSTLIARAHAAKAAYRNQICQEARGGIPLSTTRDRRSEYLAALAELEALENAARAAGVPAGWYRVSWSDFPPPEDHGRTYDAAGLARRWDCGTVG